MDIPSLKLIITSENRIPSKPHSSLIYFLLNDLGECIYIGSTQNLFSRLRHHQFSKNFSDYRILEISKIPSETFKFEKIYISKYKPSLNVTTYGTVSYEQYNFRG